MEIRVLNNNPIYDYKHACLITKGKNVHKVNAPDDELEFWVKHICTEHSTLRFIDFVITDAIPKSCISQIIRATKGHPQPEVESSRPDWCGKERSPDPYEIKLFCEKFTAESFLAMCRQRLCHKTESNTRAIVIRWVTTMMESEDPFIKAVGLCAEPQCMYKGMECSELESCGFCQKNKWERIMEKIKHD